MTEPTAEPNPLAPAERRRRIVRIGIGLVLATWLALEPVLRSDFSGYAALGSPSDGVAFWGGISRMLDLRLLGLDVRGQHVANLVLHVANVLLLFGLLIRATGAVWRSAFVAALFGLHPLQVEPVAWISARREVLATTLGLLSLWAYVAYARRGGPVRYLATAALLAVGLAVNPMLATLPVLFLLLDRWPLDRLRRGRGLRVWVEKLPLLAIAAAGAVALAAQSRAAGAVEAVPLSLRAANALVSCVRYAGKTLWPSGLSPLYPHPDLPGGTPWEPWQVAASGLLLVGISLLASRRRYALTGWLWYLVALVPGLGLVPLEPEAMADRHAYVPLIGLFVIASWGGAELLAKIPNRRNRVRRVAVAGAVALLAVCLVRTWVQTLYWSNAVTLYLHALAVEPSNPLVRFKLARVLADAGETDAAIEHLRQGLDIDPGQAGVRFDLAIALAARGDTDEAIDEFRRVLETRPDLAEARINLGALLQARGDRAEAIDQYRRALEIRPDSAQAHFNLGSALQGSGEREAAIVQYRRALELRPDYLEAHFNLANALMAAGEADEAIEHYREALRLKPDFALAHNNLGGALASRGEIDEAIAQYRAALAADPKLDQARENLEVLLEMKGAEGPVP
jgi:tetratricopeptide (TPR) repeat protein